MVSKYLWKIKPRIVTSMNKGTPPVMVGETINGEIIVANGKDEAECRLNFEKYYGVKL